MKPKKIFIDAIHHKAAEATNKIQAWNLIRTEIRRLNYINNTNLQIPTLDDIKEATD